MGTYIGDFHPVHVGLDSPNSVVVSRRSGSYIAAA